ncbi:MAG: DUF4215 domain-containing protein [Myxococcota bacterium]
MTCSGRRIALVVLALSCGAPGACGDDQSGGVGDAPGGGDAAATADGLGDVLADASGDARADATQALDSPDPSDATSLDGASGDTASETANDAPGATDGEAVDSAPGDSAVDDIDGADGVDGVPDVGAAECASDDDCDDGVFCNGRERCSAGACFASPTPRCADQIDCTVEQCDEDADRCLFVVDSTRCEPGQVCNPKAGCFTPLECVRDEDCDDGLSCDGAETCSDHTCQPGSPTLCDDGIACTSDECVEGGGCQHVPIHGLCLATELCDAELGCTPRPPCTRDDDCDDASFCNGVETCDLGTGACVPGALPTVADQVACTIDACSEEQAMVVHRPNNLRCSDGLFCDGVEVCHPVDGCRPGTPPGTSDGVACTTDRCDESADFIEHTPDDSYCDNGLFCDGAEFCHPLDDCQEGEPPRVNDGVGCTLDSCSEVQKAVTHTPSAALCDDDLYCNGVETCDPIAGCKAGAPVVIDDGIGCTVDACDDAGRRVTHTPDHASCDDGDACNGVESCLPTLDCQSGAPAAAGTVCPGEPRSICLAGTCGVSICGDHYVDAGRNEQCDDGNDVDDDGCHNDCTKPAVVGYDGLWDVSPDLAYTCAIGLVDYDIRTVTMTIVGSSITVYGAPSAPGTLSGTISGNTFSATLVLPGGCKETYTLSGTFSDATAWTGSFTRQYTPSGGFGGGCFDCVGAVTPVSGRR